MKNSSDIIQPSEKIILALDGMNKQEVFSLISELPDLKWVKVGLELFVNYGPAIILDLRDKDKKIFLDLKFHDIPTTMANACYQAGKLGSNLISVHCCAGVEALRKSNEFAIKGASEEGLIAPLLLGVTVLTSWNQALLNKELSVNHSIMQRVQKMASLASISGLGGCVCSPLEAKNLRINYPQPFELVTPGIRLKGNSFDDQSRVMEPVEALNQGASRLVIGRSISKAENPNYVFNKLCDQLACAI